MPKIRQGQKQINQPQKSPDKMTDEMKTQLNRNVSFDNLELVQLQKLEVQVYKRNESSNCVFVFASISTASRQNTNKREAIYRALSIFLV